MNRPKGMRTRNVAYNQLSSSLSRTKILNEKGNPETGSDYWCSHVSSTESTPKDWIWSQFISFENVRLVRRSIEKFSDTHFPRLLSWRRFQNKKRTGSCYHRYSVICRYQKPYKGREKCLPRISFGVPFGLASSRHIELIKNCMINMAITENKNEEYYSIRKLISVTGLIFTREIIMLDLAMVGGK